MIKEETKFAKDLEHLNRRIQDIKRRLGDSETKTRSLEKSLKENIQRRPSGKQKRKSAGVE
jgi:hypothetical protein